MLTVARVTPRSLAWAATSGSAMKLYTCPPNLASTRLLIPAMAMVVSVTISAPLRKASTPRCTAASEKQRLSA